MLSGITVLIVIDEPIEINYCDLLKLPIYHISALCRFHTSAYEEHSDIVIRGDKTSSANENRFASFIQQNVK